MANQSVGTGGALSNPVKVAEAPHYSEFHRVVRIFFGRKLAVFGFVVIVLLILIAIFAPLIATHDPYSTDVRNKLQQPSLDHFLGTDAVGRDTFSRVVYGARTSLIVGIVSVSFSAIVGMSLGITAGYFGGWTYNIIMRLIDVLMAVPALVLTLLISGLVGGGIKIVIIAMAITSISPQCRIMCGQVLSVKQNEYVMAGRVMGVSNLRLMLRHIFPNAFPPLLVVITMGLGNVILGEAALSFLGVGILPPTCAWGSMVNDGYQYLLKNPILSFAPGVAIMLVVFGFNMMGDGLRDALDPRLRGAF